MERATKDWVLKRAGEIGVPNDGRIDEVCDLVQTVLTQRPDSRIGTKEWWEGIFHQYLARISQKGERNKR